MDRLEDGYRIVEHGAGKWTIEYRRGGYVFPLGRPARTLREAHMRCIRNGWWDVPVKYVPVRGR